MSKISPLQAAALGLKPNPIKQVAAKPATTMTTPKPAMPTPSAPKSTVKPVTVAKVASKKPVAKSASVKPATAKTALKSVAKPKADYGKKNKKNDHNDHKKDDKKAKPEKAKVEKIKMERDSFTMPKDEYAQLTLLKARLTSMGQPAKKSELLRAGIKLLAAMSDNTLKTTLAKIPVIKTGRPNKKD